MRVGFARRREYITEKRFLSEKYKKNEVMSIATFKKRCVTSGEYYLHGLYPMEDLRFKSD